MSTINYFEELEIWQLARLQCKSLKMVLTDLQKHKEFELNSQMKRSSGSVMDNIAEGFERGGNPEFIDFLSISKGSNGELRSQLYKAFDYDLISVGEFDNFAENNRTISKKIKSLMEYLKSVNHKGIKFKSK